MIMAVNVSALQSALAANWIALVNPDGTVAQFSTSDATFVGTNGQQTVTLDNAQQLALHVFWPNCLWSNSALYVASSFTNATQTIARDPLLVQEENYLISAAQAVGITKTNTPAQMNSIWTSAIASATNTAQTISLVRQEAKFWAFLSTLGLAVTGNSTTNIAVAVQIYTEVP
jgi:hypothetical protein